ncbi:MAG: hypothetical protein OXU25_00015 [Thaumarchaeota archaeon]|nr:hypothetical protein [Nitrososphaerota archaeon]
MSAVTLGIAVLAAMGPVALAQGADEPEGGQMAEELRQIREQMGDIARSNDALVWISIGVSAASILAMGLITVYLIKRQLEHMDKDARIKRRPILSWTKFADGSLYKISNVGGAPVLKIRLINVGHIAALGIACEMRPTNGGMPYTQNTEGGLIGSLAPNAHTEIPVMLFGKGGIPGRDAPPSQVDVHITYRTIENQALELDLRITYHNGVVGITESHG